MHSLKVTTVGSSSSVILNREVQARLGIKKGDVVFITDAPGGGFRITPYNPDFERQMKLAEDIMHDDRDILRALAK